MDFFKSIPVHMSVREYVFNHKATSDFDGQYKAERLSRIIITLFGCVGLIWGYAIQQFSQTVYILAAGFLLAGLLTIPPWPMYRKKPLNWQPARDGDSNSSSKTKKKK